MTLGVSWTPHPMTGWGVYGTQLALRAEARGDVEVVPLGDPPDQNAFEAADNGRLAKPLMARERYLAMTNHRPGPIATGFPVMHALLNGFMATPATERFKGSPDIGAIFLEDAALTDEMLDRARRYDLIVAGSNWNEQVLRRYGLSSVTTVIQGIDPARFYPGTKPGAFPDRFCVFGGGKLEYRKGQDLLIAAFRRFAARHSDALLVTAWQNIWPGSSNSIGHARHVDGPPELKPNGRQDIAAWAVRNGISVTQVVDLGLVPNSFMGRVVRDMDVAVFPNRCEGGTNLAAMEVMASGIPTVLSANTGHLDIITDEGCYALTRQGPVTGGPDGADDWGESSIDEIEEALEWAYANREAAKEMGQKGADAMSAISWPTQIDQLIDAIRAVGG
jgi:glycosyltransferase involved in cell wall biosynthesis